MIRTPSPANVRSGGRGSGSRWLAAYGAALALLCAFVVTYTEHPSDHALPDPYAGSARAYAVGALVALVSTFLPGRWRLWRAAMLFAAVATGAAASTVDALRLREMDSLIWGSATVPLLAAGVLVLIGEPPGRTRRGMAAGAVCLTIAAAMLAFPGWLGLPLWLPEEDSGGTILFWSLVATNLVAVCAAAIMPSRPRAGALGALLAVLAVSVGVLAGYGAATAATAWWLVLCALLGSAAFIAWRSGISHEAAAGSGHG